MSRIVVFHGIDDLASDMRGIATKVTPDMSRVVRKHLILGADEARDLAERSAGSHGKHYPRSITVGTHSALSGEYGPDPSMPQGGMSFEFGSRNQPPHLDLAKSADLIGPRFAEDVSDTVEGWFW